MTHRTGIVLLALQLCAAPVFAQGDAGFQRWPSRGGERSPAPAPQGGGGGARERGAEPRRGQPARPPATAAPAPSQPDRGRDRTTARRTDRDDDRGRVAVPRRGPTPRVAPRSNRPNVYVVRPPAYRYTPRFNRPYAFGALGPGYFYYGSLGWYPRATFLYDQGYFGRGYAFDSGEVRLRVEPRWAEVYVDGFYAGTVDDFDGTFQSLRLESGPYHVEIVAPGYETLEVDLRVMPGQKITYRGVLRPEF